MIPQNYDHIILKIRRLSPVDLDEDDEHKEVNNEFCRLIRYIIKKVAKIKLHEEWLLNITESNIYENLIEMCESYIVNNIDIEKYMSLCYETHKDPDLWSMAYNIILYLYEMNNDEKKAYGKLMTDRVMAYMQI